MVTSQAKDGLFYIHTQSRRFANLVSGHSVLELALCPASMYLECVAMAAQEVVDGIGDKSLWFEILTIEKPLGLDSSRAVSLSLDHDEERQAFTYKVESNLKQDPKEKATLHGQGRFSFLTRQQLSRRWSIMRDQRMVESRISALSANPERDTLKNGRVYNLFGRVVDYSDVLQGINIISFSGLEAVAVIVTPEHTEFADTTALKICDTVALDNFLQVAGLLINSSEDHCGRGDCFITTAIDSVFLSPECDFETCHYWKVYTMITPPSGRKATADIFILTKAGQLVATMIGVQFTKLPMKYIRRVLRAANKLSSEGPLRFEGDFSDVPSALTEDLTEEVLNKIAEKSLEKAEERGLAQGQGQPAQTINEAGHDASSTMPQLRELLIQLVAANVGIDKSVVDINATFENLGLDSLSLMDLGSEIEEKAGIDIDVSSEASVASLLAHSSGTSLTSSMPPTRAASGAATPIQSNESPLQQNEQAKSAGSTKKQEDYMLNTMPYKKVDDLDVEADIYFPKAPPSEPMPIGRLLDFSRFSANNPSPALMIHAGGFMTMSKSFIRPAQTKLLLDHGILPVSIDYRLVPEINLHDGAMSDVHDGLLWVQNDLPSIAKSAGVEVDSKNVVVVGWSAGGHLGMSLAWTCKEPPKVILTLYAPSDFESPGQ